MIIYKCTNIKNGKVYIGATIRTLNERKNQHIRCALSNKDDNKRYFYNAIRKHGVDNFIWEIIDSSDSYEQLMEKEKYWIKYYNTYPNQYNMTAGGQFNAGDSHPSHKLTEKDVIDIRTRYNNLERRKEVYELYKERIGESGFSKIWKGYSWKNIMPEVYTEQNKAYHLHDTANKGSNNGRSRLTEDEVRTIRLRRKNGDNIREVYKDYQDKLTYRSFTNIWTYQNWKDIIV